VSPQEVVEGILDVDVAVTQSDDFLHYAGGGRLLPGSEPLAHRYGGHQVKMKVFSVYCACIVIKSGIKVKEMLKPL